MDELAPLRYIHARYGRHRPDWSPGWYDRGGYLTPGVADLMNESDTPDRVTPPDTF